MVSTPKIAVICLKTSCCIFNGEGLNQQLIPQFIDLEERQKRARPEKKTISGMHLPIILVASHVLAQ